MSIKLLSIWDYSLNINECLADIELNHQTIDEIIIDQTPEHQYNQLCAVETGVASVVELAGRYNIPITILTSASTFDPTVNNFNHPTVDCPTWWLSRTLILSFYYLRTLAFPIDMLDDTIGTGYPIQHLFISMNNVAHYHRCVFIDLMAKHDLIDLGMISWRDVLREYDNSRDTLPNNILESIQANVYSFKYWTPIRMILDQPLDGTSTVPNQYKIPEQYHNSFMQIVTESTTDRFFITEKTATPLFYNKLFLVVGSRYFHRNLKSLGFELYDELFDYMFDDEESIELRVEGVAQNLNKFRDKTNEELEQILLSVGDKITRNRKLAVQYALNPPEIFKALANRLEDDGHPSQSTHLIQITKGITQCIKNLGERTK
jgi:hypothetical protein